MLPVDRRSLRQCGRALLLLLVCLCGGRLAPPARAGSYPESTRPVYLGMGGATFAGGSVDCATGAAIYKMNFGSIRSYGRVPVTAGFLWKGQDNSPGPFGPGTYMLYDWFLQYDGAMFRELVGPGNRRFAFETQDANGNWIDTRDPEMLGATLHVPQPPTYGVRNYLVWKDGTTWYFDGYGSNGLQTIVDPHGTNVIYWIYRDATTGMASKILLASGTADQYRYVYFTYTNGVVTNIDVSYDLGGSLDKVWNFTYDGSGRLSTVTNPLGGVTSFTWTTYTRDDGKVVPLLATVTSPRGNAATPKYAALTSQYDSLGRVIRQTYADASYVTASYPAGIGTNGTTTVTDPYNHTRQWSYTWESSPVTHLEGYHVNSYTDALGRVTQWNPLHSGSYLDTQVIDYRNRTTTMGWDFAKGNLTSRSWTTPLNATATESFGYDPATSVLTSSTDALSRTASATVNAAGDVTSTTDARNNTTSITRNSYGDATTVTNALNQASTFTFGNYGEPLTSTDALNHTTTRTFDIAGRVTSVQDANGKTVNLTYDLMDRLLTQSQVVGGQTLTTTYFYDADGDRVQMTDPKNQIWKWSFDSMDRVSTETDPNSKSISYSYDQDSNVSGWTDQAGNRAAFTYDAENRPLTKTFTYANNQTDSTVTYSYDPTTQLLTSIVDSAAPGNQTWSYSYDSRDRVKAVTTPYGTVTMGLNDKLDRRDSLQAGAQGTITYGFDNNDDTTSITQNGATASLTYDALNRMTQQSLPTSPNPVITAWAFDAAGFLSSVTSTKNGTTLDSHTYLRDAVGNITQETIGGPEQFDVCLRLR